MAPAASPRAGVWTKKRDCAPASGLLPGGVARASGFDGSREPPRPDGHTAAWWARTTAVAAPAAPPIPKTASAPSAA
jgi:hypothetical protein